VPAVIDEWSDFGFVQVEVRCADSGCVDENRAMPVVGVQVGFVGHVRQKPRQGFDIVEEVVDLLWRRGPIVLLGGDLILGVDPQFQRLFGVDTISEHLLLKWT